MQRTILFTVAALLALGGFASTAEKAHGQSEPAKLMDLKGDPLPAGALARLGTVRWRHGGATTFVAFLPDGKTVVSAGDDRLVRVWDYPSGKEIRRFGSEMKDDPTNINGRVIYYGQGGPPVALTRDGKTAACNFDGGDIRLYEVATGKDLPALKDPNTIRGFGYTSTMEFSPDGRHLAVLENDSSIRIWDWAGAKEIRHFNVPQLNNAIFGGYPALAWSPDGKLLATVNLELVNNMVSYSVKLWDAAVGKEARTIALPQNIGGTSPAFSPDGKTLAFAGFDGSVTLVEVDTGKEIRKLQDGKGRGVLGVSFSPSGKSLYTRGVNEAGIRELDVATGKEVRQIGNVGRLVRGRIPYGVTMARTAVSPSGEVLAVAGLDNALRFFDIASGNEVHGEGGHPMPILAIQFAQDGKTVWTLADDPMIRKWDGTSGKELTGVKLPTNSLCAAVSSDGKYVATQPQGIRGIQIIDVATGKEFGSIQPPARGFYANLAFSPDASTLAVRFQQGANKIDLYDPPQSRARPGLFGYVSNDPPLFTRYELAPAKVRRSLNINTGYPEPGVMVTGPITIAPGTMIFSHDGRTLAAYSDPNALSLWDTVTGRKLSTLPLANRVQIQSGAFSRDGAAWPWT
jgi:WD40 repeat protein